jgi:carbonic anhydrase
VEIVFDQGIGDIFAIRVAGNVCGTDEMGSIEYAEEHLGSPLLVVLGHTECGAVTAATVGAEVHGNVKPVIDRIAPAVRQAHIAHPELSGKALVPCAIEANVWQGVEDLLKKSPATRHRVEAGKLKVVGAIYDVKDGQVKWLGEHPQQSQLLKNAH